MEYILPAVTAFLALAAVILLAVLLARSIRSSHDTRLLDELHEEMRLSRGETRDVLRQYAESASRTASSEKQYYYEAQEARLQELSTSQKRLAEDVHRALLLQDERLRDLAQKEEALRQNLDGRMKEMREENVRQTEELRKTVDERLEKSLESQITRSFGLVNERLEQVYKGLGEMQTLASGVGDLKKVLTNVKTKGILGELQLGAILEDILSPDQYLTDVATIPGSRDRVEYAVKMPGNGGGTVLLPIDAKFPAEPYQALEAAYEAGSPEEIGEAARFLVARLRAEARDIRQKYVEPPHTTDFAILFLPFEGLYAEAVRHGLIESLQRDYRVNLAGPSTMAALLNSLQLGFRNLAIQKRSAEVWEVLLSVKAEFEKFGEALALTDRRLSQAQSELENLVGVRTRQIQRRLDKLSSPAGGEASFLPDASLPPAEADDPV